MARYSCSYALLWSLLFGCLLAGKGLARPNEEEPADYANDDYPEYQDGDETLDKDETYTGPPPTILATPLNLTKAPGDTVYLPCDTENAASFATIWMNNTDFLWTDSIRITKDARLSKFPNNTVVIRNVGPGDSGIYTCEISAQPVIKVSHTLHVPSPARIIEMIPKKTTLMKGETLTLECIVSGYPKPTITWTRKHKRLPSGENELEASSITIANVHRHHEGTYECAASNGLGKPVHHSVTIHIHYEPEIVIEKELVNTAEGYESELTCTVHAEPKATVEWLHDGVKVRSSEEVHMTATDNNRNILRLANTKKNDFGTYTCRAKNSIGTTQKDVKLAGQPTRPQFVGREKDSNEMSQTLEWTVESSSPITEYELHYRKDKMTWETVAPVVENPEGNKYSVKHRLTSLAPGPYEVFMKARNTYGWSEPSLVQSFTVEYPNGDGTANPAPSSLNGSEDSRPRLFALMTVVSLAAILF